MFRRRALDRDLEDELRFHIAMREEKNRAMDLDSRAALRQFGNVTLWKEVCREMWTLGWVEILWQDIRYALRGLRKSPGFTAVAVAALAIGIGANTAIFSVVNAVVLKPLPYPNPNRLVLLWGNVRRAKVERRGASYPDFADWRKQSRSFVDLAGYDSDGVTLLGGDEPERITVELVSASYFPILGVSPILGRTFLASEDQVPMRDPVAMISEGLWKRRFAADPNIIGRTIRTSLGISFKVIGVMPSSFASISEHVDLWVPFMMAGSAEDLSHRGNRGMGVVGRLKPGVSVAQAQSELDVICRGLERQYPDTNQARGVEVASLENEIFGDIRPAVLVLLGAVAFVLLIACANVANLLLARSEARQREIAMRVALGAGRMRLWRQLTTESCVLAAIGGGAGMLLAVLGVRALMAASPITFPPFVHPAVDLPIALFTLGVSFLCGAVMGLAPAANARTTRLEGALRESSGRSSGGLFRRRFRNGLVAAEVALTLVLLIGAGLLIRSFREVMAVRPGFDADHLVCLSLSLLGLQPQGDSGALIGAGEILDRIRALPSVESAAAGTDLPLSGNESATFYAAEGQPALPAQTVPRAYSHRVTPEFFATLHTKLIAGRTFLKEEMRADSGVVMVSENVVKRFWPGQDPINKRIKFDGPASKAPWLRIVGVVGEMKYRGLPNNPTADPDIYRPWLEKTRNMMLVVRTTGDPATVGSSIRAAIREINKNIPVYDVAAMSTLIGHETARSRFTSWLMGIFAGVALLLATVGLYGVMSYTVTRRTQEIGVRMALGAGRAQVLVMVVLQGMPLILAGVAAGLAASFALTRLLAVLLYGVAPTDGLTFFAVTMLLISIAVVACLLPAWRASRVDAIRALRYE